MVAMTKHSRRKRVGSVRRQPNGRYLARIQSGVRADGSPRTMSKTFDTEQEADAWLMAKSIELGGRPDLGAGITLRMLWEAYKADRAGKLANSTLARYDGCMTRHWFPAMGDTDISTISVSLVQRTLDMIPGRTDAKQCKSALSSALTWAVRNGMLAENPIRTASFTYPGDTIFAWEDESAFDDDPFGAIEQTRNTWSATDVLRAFPLMHGLPLEPVWLAMVGSGARLEEAFALRRMDVRRVTVNGSEVTQLALHHAVNVSDGRHRTKSRKSARIVAMLEPFGERYFELAESVARRDSPVCHASPNNQNREWRRLFTPLPSDPERLKHVPKAEGLVHRGVLAELPYIPLSRMRATHETLMQEAGVLDSINAAMHGHSERVSYRHYQQADGVEAAKRASSYLRVVS